MKKYLYLLVAGLGLAAGARGALILDEPFTYADGALTAVSASAWTNYSGTALQVDVVGGKVNVSQSEAEDVARPLAGAPYNDNNISLYASFVVNFSVLPQAGVGTYFVCFKDGGSSNLKGRTFATTAGAGSGMFRVGIANGGNTPVVIPRDLSLGTDYLLVIRYNSGTAASTLWINPGSEGATSDTANGNDSTGAVGINTFVLRQSNASGGMGVLTLDDLKVGTAFGDVVSGGDPTMNPPFISSIANQNIPRNVTVAVPFYVTDGETAHGSLTVAATASSNPTLVPLGNVSFTSGDDSNRLVTVTPATGEQGFSEITVTVTDGHNNTASRSFLVIVGAPTISTFTNIVTPRNTTTPSIAFTVDDVEGDTLTLTALSTNENVVPVSGIMFSGSGANRTLTITPAADTNGLSRVTVIVSDGFNTASNSFVITVFPTLHVVVCDGFDYPDGPLVTVAGNWGTHSGTPQEVLVSGGKILLSGANTEDVSVAFTNPPSFTAVSFPPHEGWIVYSSFIVNFSSRPATANGDYFAHFRNAGTGTSFGGKVFATTNGAAAGKLRLGVSNSANAPANTVIPTDLDLGVNYTVVTRYNVGTGQTKLWINPTSENDPGAVPTDNSFPFIVETYAFREPGGANNPTGNMSIDNVKVGTAFSDVVPPALTITAVGNNVTISWPASATDFVLRFTDSFPATWQDFNDQGTVQGDMKVVTLNGVTANRFFELRKP